MNQRHVVALDYAKELTQNPSALSKESVELMRKDGWSDGEILEINQVAAYFINPAA